MGRLQLLVTWCIICCLFGCIEYDGGFPLTEKIPVVNGVLMADSVIAVQLSWSGHPDSTRFEPIGDARVELFENDESLGLAKEWNPGNYRLPHLASANKHYRLSVSAPQGIAMSAEDFVPQKPDMTCTLIRKDEWGENVFELEVSALPDPISALYIYAYSPNEDGSWEQSDMYYCNSPLADSFNRAHNSMGPDGFSYSFDLFVRCPAEGFINGKGSLLLAADANRIQVIAVSETFDLYYKAAFWQRYYDPEIQLPFTWQAIHLPSNIEGGAGLFAGMFVVEFDLSQPEVAEN
ncbi:MAG: DUF4249 domain-containing protein [Marinilabiliaceae bacterium]|nr:DUF4249 domain-containing protein [Marinilabiliaceae bacterium]